MYLYIQEYRTNVLLLWNQRKIFFNIEIDCLLPENESFMNNIHGSSYRKHYLNRVKDIKFKHYLQGPTTD